MKRSEAVMLWDTLTRLAREKGDKSIERFWIDVAASAVDDLFRNENLPSKEAGMFDFSPEVFFEHVKGVVDGKPTRQEKLAVLDALSNGLNAAQQHGRVREDWLDKFRSAINQVRETVLTIPE